MDTFILVVAALGAIIITGCVLIELPYIKAKLLLRREMNAIRAAVFRFVKMTGEFPHAHQARANSMLDFQDLLPLDLAARVFWNQPQAEYTPSTYYVMTRWPAPDRIGCTVRGSSLVRVKGQKSTVLDYREEREINIKR